MVGLIAVVIIVAVTTLGKQLRSLFEGITGSLGGATPAAPAAG
jgi:Flp pilus assembly pilin Flp